MFVLFIKRFFTNTDNENDIYDFKRKIYYYYYSKNNIY